MSRLSAPTASPGPVKRTGRALCLGQQRAALKPGTLTGVEDPADHAGEHHEEHGQQLQVATQDAARLHVGQVLSREAALDDHLDA